MEYWGIDSLQIIVHERSLLKTRPHIIIGVFPHLKNKTKYHHMKF